MFTDPDKAYMESEKYYTEQLEAWQPEEVNDEGTVPGTDEIQE